MSSPSSPREGTVLWTPSATAMEQSQMEHFRRYICDRHGLALSRRALASARDPNPSWVESYQELHAWSVANSSEFWAAVWEFCKVIHSQDYDQVVDETIPIDEIPVWFSGARLNFAENLLRYRDDRPAIIYESKCPQGCMA